MATAVSSGLLSASAVVFNGKTFINGILAGGDGTNVATINVYNGLSNAGQLVAQAIVPAGVRQNDLFFNIPVQTSDGLYVEVLGIGASAFVFHGGI